MWISSLRFCMVAVPFIHTVRRLSLFRFTKKVSAETAGIIPDISVSQYERFRMHPDR